MTGIRGDSYPSICGDAELDYLRARTPFAPNRGMTLDASYRLAHLPLVAQHHPKVIARQAGKDYVLGRRSVRVFSLVLRIPEDALEKSEPFRRMEAEVRAAPFAKKISWENVEQRKGKLHATICGYLSTGSVPTIDSRRREALSHIGPIAMDVFGLFSGVVNVGRLYLRLYPERRPEMNAIHEIQTAMGWQRSNLYPIGIYNLVDDLTPVEAEALSNMISRWWGTRLARLEVTSLDVVGAMDDLLLDANFVEGVPLV
jgi:hypothetical protein